METRKITISVVILLLPIYLLAQARDTLQKPGPFDEGYFFIGPDDLLKFKGYVQTDVYFPIQNSPGFSEFLIRRARLAATGYFQQHFRYMLYARFDRGEAELNEAFLESRHLSFARIRVGQFKVPFSLSNLTSSSQLHFINRPVVIDNFAPGYDIGAMAFGTVWERRIDYAVGIFNGQPQNEKENNAGKNFVGRMVFVPFQKEASRFTKNLFLGFSVASNRQNEAMNDKAYETGTGIPFFSFSDSIATGVKSEYWGADVEWIVRSAALRAEYLRVENKVAKADEEFTLSHEGFYIDLAYLLTGEEQQRNSVLAPKHNFEPSKGTWGAFELALRYERINLSRRLNLLNYAQGAFRVESITIGANWYPNDDVKVSLNYQRLHFTPSIEFDGNSFSNSGFFKARFQYQFQYQYRD